MCIGDRMATKKSKMSKKAVDVKTPMSKKGSVKKK